MSEEELKSLNLKNGLYRINWNDGGNSLAAIGRLHDGSLWFAPTNWTSKCEHGIASIKWEMVGNLELLHA